MADEQPVQKSVSVLQSMWNFLSTHHCEGCCNHSSCFISVLRGIRNGAIYGAKIRAPHALVMTFLFRSGDLRSKVRSILKATYLHSKNLATFVGLFKFLVCLMRHLRGKETSLNTLVAGFLGGWYVWGDFNPVNSQINMYILSRIIHGTMQALLKQGFVTSPPFAFQTYAAVCWAIVMYLFFYQEGTLQNSLISSMTYLYTDSDSWPSGSDVSIVDWVMA